MFTLKKFQLQDFSKHASGISGGGLPIFSYIRLAKDGTLSKTNQAISVSYQIDIEGEAEDILLDERTLFNLVNKSNSDVITIKVEDKAVLISDKINHLNHAREEFSMFPNLPAIPTDSTPMKVTAPIINTIKIARSFIASDDNAANFRAVHIKDNFISAFNFHLFYIKEFKFKFPHVILMDEFCDIITQYSSADFWETQHHYFYRFSSKLMFAFTKTEYTTPDVNTRVDILRNVNTDSFVMKKSDITDFCELANNLTDSKQVICSFAEDPKHGSVLMLQDNDYAKGVKREIKVEGVISQFNFNSKKVIGAFKALPEEALKCTIYNNGLIINQNDYWACFMGAQV